MHNIQLKFYQFFLLTILSYAMIGAAVVPVLDDVYLNWDGSYTAVFGYENNDYTTYTIPEGDDNFLTGEYISYTPAAFPTQFDHGTKSSVLLVKFPKGAFIFWSITANGKTYQQMATSDMVRDETKTVYADGGNAVFESVNGQSFELLHDNISGPAGIEGRVDARDNKTLYYIKDHLGSTRVVVNKETGNVEEALMYNSYGNLHTISSSSSAPVKEKFTGKEYDLEGPKYALWEFSIALTDNNHYGFSSASAAFYFDDNSSESVKLNISPSYVLNCDKAIAFPSKKKIISIVITGSSNYGWVDYTVNFNCNDQMVETEVNKKRKITLTRDVEGLFNSIVRVCTEPGLAIGNVESYDQQGTGLVYFGARYYDPELGIWGSTDPADQFWSSYSYSSNGFSVINSFDPNGKQLHDGSSQFWRVNQAAETQQNIQLRVADNNRKVAWQAPLVTFGGMTGGALLGVGAGYLSTLPAMSLGIKKIFTSPWGYGSEYVSNSLPLGQYLGGAAKVGFQHFSLTANTIGTAIGAATTNFLLVNAPRISGMLEFAQDVIVPGPASSLSGGEFQWWSAVADYLYSNPPSANK